MSYFVVDRISGQKYGPADLQILNEWAIQGRIVAETLIEDLVTGSQLPAKDVIGLRLSEVTMSGQAYGQFQEPTSPYPRPTLQPGHAPGQQDATSAWVYLALGFAVCSVIFLPMSIIYANRAAAKGNSSASVAKILSIVLIILNLLVLAVVFLFIGLAANS